MTHNVPFNRVADTIHVDITLELQKGAGSAKGNWRCSSSSAEVIRQPEDEIYVFLCLDRPTV